MPDTNIGSSDWSEREPYKSFVKTAEGLEARGATAEDLTDAMLSLALSWASAMRGPRHVAERLWLLSMKFAAEGGLGDPDAKGGGDGLVH